MSCNGMVYVFYLKVVGIRNRKTIVMLHFDHLTVSSFLFILVGSKGSEAMEQLVWRLRRLYVFAVFSLVLFIHFLK
jgi:hypothetical protein